MIVHVTPVGPSTTHTGVVTVRVADDGTLYLLHDNTDHCVYPPDEWVSFEVVKP